MNDKQSNVPENGQETIPQTAIEQTPPPNFYVPKTIMQSAIEKNMIGYFKDRTNTIIAILLAVLVGVSFTFLVVEYALKINVFIFYTLMMGATGFIMYRDDNLNVRVFAFFAAAFLAMASVFFRSSFDGYLVVAGLLLPIIFVMTTVMASKQKYASNIKTFLFRAVCGVGLVDKIVIALGSLKNKESTKKRHGLQILIGAGITIVLLCVIIPLMISADEMFAVTLNDIFGDFAPMTFILKSILSAVLAMVFFGFVFIITVKRLKVKEVAQKKETPSFPTVILTIIIALAVVFSFFAIVQFNYLFVGARSNLPADFNPAEYARNGYFQLVVLSVISFFIILISVHFSKKGSRNAARVIRIILAYFNVLNIYILASAAYKMALYQREFGLTASRLLVYILLAFEAVLLIGLMVKVFKANLPFVKYAIYYCTMFWALASFVNVEALAVRYNVSTQYEQGEFDFESVRRMSADASNALYEFYTENYEELDSSELRLIERYYGVHGSSAASRSQTKYETLYRLDNWREFNIADMSKYNAGMRILQRPN
ncbi:MAG: DUF4173 domain-containing protein [Clostridia bacterium]|jgi:hypothetical protein|nr:DUF4173 domain-containing protein [Clostridia bacterium]MBT7122312.1 DUF4173 domain-containing protein [Clostridia bacterium]